MNKHEFRQKVKSYYLPLFRMREKQGFGLIGLNLVIAFAASLRGEPGDWLIAACMVGLLIPLVIVLHLVQHAKRECLAVLAEHGAQQDDQEG